MKLTTAFTCAFALIFAGLLVLPEDADAKRFGAGRSLGKSYQTMPRQAQPPKQASQPRQTQPGAAGTQTRPQSGMGRWLGPLAGLAAGGLLASMLFGEGFEGISFMDIIVIAGLLIGGIFLFRMLRRGRPAPGAIPASQGAGASPVGAAYQPESEPAPATQAAAQRTSGFTPPDMGSAPPSAQGSDQLPHWFDGIAFIEGAKTHFIRLQAAWDQGDFRDIREYTTPQLFAELQRERERLGGKQYTEVVRLQAEMVTIQRDADQVVASIRFHGLIREEAQGVAEEFSETWHVVHPWERPEGDWLIAGIQQD